MDAETVDVVVIGAGLSGLSAARRLLERSPDLKVLVLEADDHVGGRTRTQDIRGPRGQADAVDLGGHWVANSQRHIMDLVERFDVGHYPQNVTGRKIMQFSADQRVRTYTSDIPNLESWLAVVDMHFLLKKFEALCQTVPVADPYSVADASTLDKMSVGEYLRKETRYESLYETLNSAIHAVMGCDSDQINLLYFLAYCRTSGGMMRLMLTEPGAAQELRVKGGTQQFSLKLREAIGADRVRLNQPVVSVEQGDDSTTVTTADGSLYRCKHVITTTTPHHTLKMQFSPPLRHGHTSLLKSMRMGNLSKVYVLYEDAFWLEQGFSGEVVSAGGPSDHEECDLGPLTIMYDATTSSGTPALVAFLAGRNQDQWFDLTKEERKRAVLAQLASYYGDKAREPRDYLEMNWCAEPHVTGGPVYFAAPGAMHNFHHLRQAHGKVHFAGSETATEWAGYLSGAVQSGYRAAAEVLLELDEARVTEEDRRMVREARPDRREQKQPKQGFSCAIM